MPDVTPEEIVTLLHGISRAIYRRVGGQMRRSDLPPATPLVLHLVQRRPGLTVSELSRAAGQAKSATSVMVVQLCEEGLLEKRPDPADQRLVRVFATPRLEGLRAEMHRMVEDMMGELLVDLGAAERGSLVAALRQMREAARRKGWWQE